MRIEEVYHSVQLIYQLLASLPPGPVVGPLPAGTGEGYGVAETFRGAAWCWLKIVNGLVVSCFLCDPSWLHWPLLEGAMQDGIAGDFPLVNKSFNASYSGVDL